MTCENLGRHIQYFREKRGMTQEELAELVGVGTKHISVLERGLKIPKVETIMLLSEALRVTPNDLLLDMGNYEELYPAICSKLASLEPEKQEKVSKILETLIDEL